MTQRERELRDTYDLWIVEFVAELIKEEEEREHQLVMAIAELLKEEEEEGVMTQ